MKDKEKILKTLKDFGDLPTGRIAAIIGINYYKALPILQEMWEDGQITGEVSPASTVWRLNEDKQN